MLELFLGQIPEAIYFALFMIFAKELKEKRILFITLMITEYIVLANVLFSGIWFHLSYTLITYIILKILYKEKSQITDIFIFAIASLFLMLISGIYFYILHPIVSKPILFIILNRLFLLFSIIFLKNKLKKIQKIYKFFWNRNDKIKKKIKSTTFRCINLIIFNAMFYVINIAMLYWILLRK